MPLITLPILYDKVRLVAIHRQSITSLLNCVSVLVYDIWKPRGRRFNNLIKISKTTFILNIM